MEYLHFFFNNNNNNNNKTDFPHKIKILQMNAK